MFAKKPAPPPKAPVPQTPAQPPARPAGWAVRILTPDFVVTGYMAPIEMPLVGWLNVSTQTVLSLSQAQLRALDPHAPGAGEPLAEVTLPKASIVAVLPHDELSLRSALQQMPPNAERALICAGPYWLHGSFRLMGSTPLRNLFSATASDMLPVSDVEIRAGRADVVFQAEAVAAAVVNKRWVQVYYAG
jgi:hypothetical protein